MLRILFSCDVHGSQSCFRKFVNATKYNIYNANVILLSGDLTGKALVPIIEQPEGIYTAEVAGGKEVARSQEELHSLEKRIRNIGYYPYITDSAEISGLKSDPSKIHDLFVNIMINSIRQWVQFAEEQLTKSEVQCYMMPGNDDIPEVGEVINKSNYVVNPEDKVIKLSKAHEMISTGFSNPTPWDTPRECSEDELFRKITNMISYVENLQNCVFNFHCPPYDSMLDTAPLLDENLRPVVRAGEIVMVPVGSTAVRRAIEEHQPLLGLHGHIHESRGKIGIGRTLCLNPGSAYHEGVLKAYIVDLEEGKVKRYFLVEG